VAEILLHAHGSEFVVTKFLHELFRVGVFEIQEVRRVQAPAASPAGGRATAGGRGGPPPVAKVAVSAPGGSADDRKRVAAAAPAAAPSLAADDLDVARRLRTVANSMPLWTSWTRPTRPNRRTTP
jgi:hypothetical protein